ncbi:MULTISPECIES: motility associated factor glycosyltransferase family protein [Marinobacter]|uniref:6-hydroxymethylpterin diphosphokinase MptE-like protein n=1 Tax=Marinobacter shengliensis TaxID=1389223 RepID=A0ABV4W7P5_9GAMM|nr:6-hydroxymethylpterin diphosphokinase MptE-like protein [Marinobacter shengliensis]MCD1631443.1 DUF115 domain-containing protein [Marinobacter shengliensis]
MVKNKALEFVRRRETNLLFFKKFYPDIYRYYANYKLTEAEVVISNVEDELDLNLGGVSLYQGQGKKRAHQGVELFKSTFAHNKMLPSLPPPWPGDYHHPRFAHLAIDQIIRKSPLNKKDFKGYPIPNFYPLVVFQGVGLGLQIEELVTRTDVENAIVIEPNLEIFGASLLTVDWAKVCSTFQRAGRSIRFLIGVDKTEDAIWPALVKHLMHFTPMFPVMNLFLNERGDKTMDAVAKRINREAIATLTTWGHYDDEVRQLNNALHAFHMGVKVIPEINSISSTIPTIIVGSGPSLDDRIDGLKANRENIIIVSAGTGLRVLIENDIYPDFHVELESDYLNYRVISSYDQKKLKSIRIIAASQICPLIWDLFGDQRLFFKKENPIGTLFGSPETSIAGGAPTCTNTAIALCTQLGLRNIFLFGTDFGFRDHGKHHSMRSVYMESEDDTIGTELKKGASKVFQQSNTFKVQGVNDSVVFTTPIYFTAKRAVEGLIGATTAASSAYKFFNCADGAAIEGSTWITEAQFNDTIIELGDKNEKARVLKKLFSKDSQAISLENLEDTLNVTCEKLSQLARKIEGMIKSQRVRGKKDITRLSSEISRYLEGELIKSDPGFYYMIRGAVRHHLYAGFAHALAMNDDGDVAAYLDRWKKSFTDSMAALPGHFKSVTSKRYSLVDDPWVRQSINDPE